ncbi:MAG: ATPase [Edaphobacter sp.]|nr:ATPase [Edaphobacter sp.]
MILTFDQIRKFFEHHHPGQRIGTRNKASVKCRFHDDSTPSCTLFLDGAGGFHCNGCQASGNVFQFQAKIAACSLPEAERLVAEITGAKPDKGFLAEKLGPVVAQSDYRDETGRVLYQKRRYQPEGGAKTFRTYRPDGERWIAGIDADGESTRRVLYNLPHLVTANVVAICEGEKDCDNVMQAAPYIGNGDVRFAATCNFDGAWKPGDRAKWLPEYDAFFAGKLVFVFRDNDEAGEAWSAHVAASVARYARQVRIVKLDGLTEKGDVSDWLQTRTGVDLRKAMHASAIWMAPEMPRRQPMFRDAVDFAAEAPALVEWLVEGVIPKGTNGIICGDPKASKSFHAMDLCMSVACGGEWLGMRVPRRARTALVAREDSPSLTQRRINRLVCGNGRYGLQLSDWMLVNTRRQLADFKVTTDEHLQQLIDELKVFRVELVVLDVFRSLHDSEENDNTEVQQVLQRINRIQNECECAVALVHHINKVSSDNIFKGLRGASAIHGWMEWGIGISVTNPDEEDKSSYVRKLEFENKEGTAPAIYTQIRESDTATVRIDRVARPDETQQRRKRVSDIIPMGAR